MRKFPILQVLYYTIMSLFGVIMIFYFAYEGDTVKIANTMKKAIKQEDYTKVASLMSPFYNSTEYEAIKLSNGTEIHIYEAMEIYNVEGNSNSLITPSYFGIVVNISDYGFNKEYQNAQGVYMNQSGFMAKTQNGEEVFYRIGYSEDDTKDKLGDAYYYELLNRFACYAACNYLYFQFTMEDFSTTLNQNPITEIQILNNDQSIYQTATLEKPLSFDSAYFTEAKAFSDAYNAEVLGEGDTKKLSEIYTNHMETTAFCNNSRDEVTKYVPLQSGLKVFAYFVVIIIIGDLLVGKRALLRLIMSKLPKRNKAKNDENVEYNNNYEVNVVCKAIVPEGYCDDIKVKYTKDEQAMEFVLTKEEGYQHAERFKNGTYTNPSVVANGLKAKKLPQELIIRGFKYDLTIVFESVNEA